MFASWEDFDFLSLLKARGHCPPLPRRKINMPGGRCVFNAICAFDIETSRIDLPIPAGAKQNSHAFMYIWQFEIEDYTIIGRTWPDYFRMLARIRAAISDYAREYNLDYSPRLIIWVHNLSFEWQFCFFA